MILVVGYNGIISGKEDEMTSALAVHDLTRSYNEFCALHPTSFEIPAGEIVVLSGPNGAGKTTLLLCLAGLLRPTEGRIEICGHDLYEDEVEAKQRLAFVPDIPRFYTELTAWEHLQFIALAHGAAEGFEERARAVLTELGLWEARELYPHNYSRGMRLKLGLALAFIRPFQVLVMDEPTSALDPQSTGYLQEKLLDLRHQGKTIFITSHHLGIIEALRARHWVMEQGELKRES